MKQRSFLLCAAVVAAVLAASFQQAASQPAALQTQTSKLDWMRALKGSYVESKRSVDEEGTASFAACFKGSPSKCELISLAKRDEFRKLTIFTPTASAMLRFGGSKYIHSYVSVIDCSAPAVLLDATFFSKGGWIFLSKASVMLDGEVVLDHAFAHSDVKRDNQSYGVTESGVWIASDADLSALRKVAVGRSVILRLTGDKGYVTATKEDARKFITDAKEVMQIYDQVTAALAGKTTAACS